MASIPGVSATVLYALSHRAQLEDGEVRTQFPYLQVLG